MIAITVFPVGHYGGNSSDQEHLVRVGRGLELLTDDEFGIWMLAHGLAEVGRGGWTRADILERAGDAEIAEPAACLERLLERGLLAAVPVGPDGSGEPELDEGARAFATAYRLETLLVGLGAAPDQPDRQAIGVPGVGTAALLDADAYRLWQWGGVAPTLWSYCEQDPAKPLGDVLGELRVLLVHGCAYLDAVAGTGATGGMPR